MILSFFSFSFIKVLFRGEYRDAASAPVFILFEKVGLSKFEFTLPTQYCTNSCGLTHAGYQERTCGCTATPYIPMFLLRRKARDKYGIEVGHALIILWVNLKEGWPYTF